MQPTKSKKLFYTARIADVFGNYGSTTLKVEEIASSLGITKKTLYNYFDSKQSMVECVTDYVCRMQIEQLRAGLHKQDTPIDALCFIGRSLITFSEKYVFLFKSHNGFSRTYLLGNLFNDRKKELVEIIEFCFKKGAHDGHFEQDIDHNLLSLYLLFQIKLLLDEENGVFYSEIGKSQFLQVLYFYLKGICTEKGLIVLRSAFDIRVSSS